MTRSKHNRISTWPAAALAMFALTASVCLGATYPMTTGFESYTLGNLNGQNGWQATNQVTVQNSNFYAGAKAVQLGAESQSLYEATGVTDTVVWVDAYCKTTADSVYPDLPAPSGVSCFLFFHDTDGIVCLDGDGAGGGSWVVTNVQVADWTRVAIRQDYNTNTWDLYVNGVVDPIAQGLSNAYNTTGFTKFECQTGANGTMYLDQFHAGPSEHPGISEGPPVLGAISDAGAGVLQITWSNPNDDPYQHLGLVYDIYADGWWVDPAVSDIYIPFASGATSGNIDLVNSGGYFIWVINQYFDGSVQICDNPAAYIMYDGTPNTPLDMLGADQGAQSVAFTFRPEIYGTWLYWITVMDAATEQPISVDGPLGDSVWHYIHYPNADFTAGAATLGLPYDGDFWILAVGLAWDAATQGLAGVAVVNVAP